MKLVVLLLFGIAAIGWAHPPMGGGKPSAAARQIAAAKVALEAYRATLDKAGSLSCCIKAGPDSKVDGCRMCAVNNGSCRCAANLAEGRGVCGECKGGWVEGRGMWPLGRFGYKSADEIPILPSTRQGIPGLNQDRTDSNLLRYLDLIAQAKRILIDERRFNCCVGDGGCDECALEMNCNCAPQLAADAEAPPLKRKGICAQCLDGQFAGHGRVDGLKPSEMKLMPMDHAMAGAFTGTMAQEGSGTSWLPAASELRMRDGPTVNGFRLSTMGLGSLAFADAGGKRGDSQIFANSMLMGMATRPGLQLRAAVSLDAITNGKRGYPDLFQTGETANGLPLKDRQHPHDLVMELSATWSRPIGAGWRAFLYAAPIGEPALGTAAFQHRPSASENPEAPIGHHWNDGTHITYGVLTAGLNFADRWKLEGSWFNGHEPNENRFDLDPIRLDSYAGRLSFNPSPEWSFSISNGFLRSPEALEPGVNAQRWVASAFYGKGQWSVGAIFGRNVKDGRSSDALNLEAALGSRAGTWFGRWERVEKDELVGVPAGRYPIQKWTLGYVRGLGSKDGLEYGLGAYLGVSSMPGSLTPFYGRNPVGFGIFLRLRPAAMK